MYRQVSYTEAEKMRERSKGYRTEHTHPGALETSWHKITPDACRIKFRYYDGGGIFTWSKWHEIRKAD